MHAVDLAGDHQLIDTESQGVAEQFAIAQDGGRVVAHRQTQIELRVWSARDAAGSGGEGHASLAVFGREQFEPVMVPRLQMQDRAQ